jgi:anti-anti-sigma factor
MRDLIVEHEQIEREDKKIHILRLDGYVDASTFDILKAVLDAYDMPSTFLVINMSKLRYLNSTGFGYLATAFRRASRNGGQTVLVDLHPDIQHIFELLGFNHFMITYDSEDHALEAL